MEFRKKIYPNENLNGYELNTTTFASWTEIHMFASNSLQFVQRELKFMIHMPLKSLLQDGLANFYSEIGTNSIKPVFYANDMLKRKRSWDVKNN